MNLFKTIHTIRFDTIDSTHTWGKKNSCTLDPEAFVCITALEQTAGYGRHQRTWHSPKGLNILATWCFTLPAHSSCMGNLGQVLSLSTASVLEAQGFSPEIKWPNDIRIYGKKIMGVLCETQLINNRTSILLSFALNVNMNEDGLKQIDQPATSLALVSGRMWNLDEIHNEILKQFLLDLPILMEQGFVFFREKYEQRLAFKGQTIRCFDGVKSVEGICNAILPDGRLELLLPDASAILLSAGEVIF